jgi:hypothetical protein
MSFEDLPISMLLRAPVSKVLPGSRGILVRMWYDAWRTMQGQQSLSNFMKSPAFRSGGWNSTWNEQNLFESPKNLLYARSDLSGPFGQYLGFFRPPTTSNYTFVLTADDFASLWIGNDSFVSSDMEMIISLPWNSQFREW